MELIETHEVSWLCAEGCCDDSEAYVLYSDHLNYVEKLQAENKRLRTEIDEWLQAFAKNSDQVKRVEKLEARIDTLMLEYCPDEMTEEQIANWEKHQKHSPEAG